MLEIGSLLDGKYRILSEIGRGGMSVVYLAINDRANKTWAVKAVRNTDGDTGLLHQRGLTVEMEMLKKLRHKNLPAIADILWRDDCVIMVMDYIEGRNLQDVLDREGAKDPETVIGWAKQLADVLGYLHSRNPPVIYRDMKPSNIMLKPDGTVVLIDFGTAREYKCGESADTAWLGTRGYAAPEQFGGGGQTDARTDIYCLGATLFHLLTGCGPSDNRFARYPVGRICPELAGSGIEKIVGKCCEPEPENRFRSCEELSYALGHVHDADDAVRKVRRFRIRLFLAACIAAAAGLAGVVSFSILENAAERRGYEACLVSAANASDLGDISLYYQQAMDLRPTDSRAYELMLEQLISRNDDEKDELFSKEERLVYESCIGHVSSRRRDGVSDIALLQRKNKKGYALLRLKMGLYYFTYCGNEKEKACSCMKELKGDLFLNEVQKRQRDMVELLSTCYVNLSRKALSFADEGYSFRDFWDGLQEYISDPETANLQTGREIYSLALYRETMMQIAVNIRSLKKSGVTRGEMEAAVHSADTYLELFEADSVQTEALIGQVRISMEDAKRAISSEFKEEFQKQ